MADAISAAKSVLSQKGVKEYCANVVSARDPQEKITVEEMSNIVEKIVDDTYFYNN